MAERDTLAVVEGKVLLPGGQMTTGDVLIENGRIVDIGTGLTAKSIVSAAGNYVLPGLIDIHTHGLGFESAMEGSLDKIARLEASFGVTSVYPTLFGPPDESARQMRRHRAETDELRLTPQVKGFRLESPYLARTGGGIPSDLAPVSRDLTETLLDAGGGHIRIWDVSPELPGVIDEIEYLTDAGVVCSIAHTDADVEEARAAVDAGARLVTHLFDTFVVPEMTDPGVYPAGLLDYLLVENRVVCEIIVDGTHVHPLLVEKAFRCKSADRLALVTDSNYGAGLPAGDYDLPGEWGKARISGPNNGVRLVDRDMGLAGSALTAVDGFRNTVRMFDKDIATASQVCSTTPARLLGLNTGEIAAGRDADILVLSPEMDVICTIGAGKILYSREEQAC